MYSNYGPGALSEKETRLDDLFADPGQLAPLADDALERQTIDRMLKLMGRQRSPG